MELVLLVLILGAAFSAFAIIRLVMLALVRSQLDREVLTRLRFALIFTLGWTLSLLAVYFAAVLIVRPSLDMSVIGPALLIALVNLVVAFPIAYFAYPRFRQSLLHMTESVTQRWTRKP